MDQAECFFTQLLTALCVHKCVGQSQSLSSCCCSAKPTLKLNLMTSPSLKKIDNTEDDCDSFRTQIENLANVSGSTVVHVVKLCAKVVQNFKFWLSILPLISKNIYKTVLFSLAFLVYMHTQTEQRFTSMPSHRRLISLLRLSCSDWSTETWLKKLPSPLLLLLYCTTF